MVERFLKVSPKEIEIICPTRDKLDLSDYCACRKIIEDHKPDWIINCGAYTKVDDAEKNVQLSQKINAYAPASHSLR